MKYKLATAVLAVTAMVVATLTATTVTTARPAHAAAADPGTWPIDQWGTPQPTDDAVLKWDEQLLSAIRAYPKQTGPTVASRAFGVLFTAIYDAWAAYDPVAKVTQNAGPSQQTTGNTDAHKTEAISYAAYRTLNDLFPPGQFPCEARHLPHRRHRHLSDPRLPVAAARLRPRQHHAGQPDGHGGHPGRGRQPRRQGRARFPP